MDQRIGDEVLAPWMTDGFLYPAVLVKLDGATAHVVYLDGDEADVPTAALRNGVFGAGLRVSVNWKGRRRYFGGVILSRLGGALEMKYDDGSHEWTTISQCRVEQTVLAAIHPDALACPYCGNAIRDSDARCARCGAARAGRA